MRGGARPHPPKVPPLEVDRIRYVHAELRKLRAEMKSFNYSKSLLTNIIYKRGAYKK
jgi:hypothetical protein